MAVEDPLDERRARARHAEDEDRVLGVATVDMAVEQPGP